MGDLLEVLEERPETPLNELIERAPPQFRDALGERLDGLIQAGLLPDAAMFRSGSVLAARYRIHEVAGQGGMGRVYRAWDLRLERYVAIKLLRRSDAGGPRSLRFWHEARVAARLAHPAILALHDYFELRSGIPALVLPYVTGRTLSTVLRHEPEAWSPRRRVEAVREVARALSHAHGQGILHRDVKPGNVMIGAHGEVLLMDWGLSRVRDEEDVVGRGVPSELPGSLSSESLSRTGDRLGTPGYMAPEQERGEAVDERTDVWGLGALLYAVLGGDGSAASEGPAPGRIPRELAAVVVRCRAVDPAARYPSAAAVADDLSAWLDDRQGLGWRDTVHVRLAKAARRNPGRAVALVGLTVVALLAALLLQVRTELQARAQAAADQAAVSDLRRLQEGPLRSNIDASALEQRLTPGRFLVAGLREHGVDLVAADAASVLAFLRTTADRDPRLAEELEYTLHEVAFHLTRSRAPVVGDPHWEEDLWVQWIAENEQWAPPAARTTIAILDHLETDPWRRAIWARTKELWFTEKPELEPLDPFAAIEGRSGRDILLVSRAWQTELERLQGMTSIDAEERTRKLLRQASLIEPEDGALHYVLSSMDLRARRRLADRPWQRLIAESLALAHATAGEASRPGSFRATLQRAKALASLSQTFDELSGWLTGLETSDGESVPAVEDRATLRRDSQELFELAVVGFEACLERQPNDVATLNSLANLLKSQGLLDRARKVFERALVADPEAKMTLNNYHVLLWDLGEEDGALALELLRRWIEVASEEWIPYRTFLGVLAENDRLEEAAMSLEVWVERLRRDPPLRYGRPQNVDSVIARLERCAEGLQAGGREGLVDALNALKSPVRNEPSPAPRSR